MAYLPELPPSLLNQTIGGTTRQWDMPWHDPIVDVVAPGYITNARDLGMQAGDTLVYHYTPDGEWSAVQLVVREIDESGAATLGLQDVPEEIVPEADTGDTTTLYFAGYQNGRQVKLRLGEIEDATTAAGAKLLGSDSSDATKNFTMPLLRDVVAPDFDDVAAVDAATIGAARNSLRTAGYAEPGDGGGALYKRVESEPTHAGKIQSADGSWWELAEETPNALMFGATRDGVTDDTAAIQSLFDFVVDGTALIPPGTYNVSDLTLLQKGGDVGGDSNASFSLIAQGVRFIGGGNFILDSCKRVSIHGLRAQAHDLVWRGCWWSNYYDCAFKRRVVGDEDGEVFSSSYWNFFYGGLIQGHVYHVNMTAASNATFLFGVSHRGSADQGYEETCPTGIEFNGNQDVQQLVFYGGDFSYHDDIYTIDPSATEDIVVLFDKVYFDQVVPAPADRTKTRIVVKDCHASNDMPYIASIGSASHGTMEGWRGDRSTGWEAQGLVNFVPNGDFQRLQWSLLSSQGGPVGSMNSATVTVMTGAGLFGRYINVNQALTSSNSVRFRSRALPFPAIYSGVMVLRNADEGSKLVQLGMAGSFIQKEITDTEWSVFVLTPETTQGVDGAFADVLLGTADSTAFNVDISYIGVLLGRTPQLFVPSAPIPTLDVRVTYDAPSIDDGNRASTTVSVPGCSVGDFVDVTYTTASGVHVWGYVSTAGTVTVVLQNETGATVNPGSGTLCVRVRPVTA